MFKLPRLSPVVTTVALGLALTAGGTGIAAAAGAHPASQAAAGAKAVPCRALFAVVNKGGVLQRAGCPGTSSKLLTPGHYQVLFPRNVRRCYYSATIGNAGSQAAIKQPGLIGVAGRTGHTNGVFVETFKPDGSTALSIGFHLIVACP